MRHFQFHWWHVADGPQQMTADEPIYPLQGRIFDFFDVLPWAFSMDDLDLVQTVVRLRQGIVIGITPVADRSLDASL